MIDVKHVVAPHGVVAGRAPVAHHVVVVGEGAAGVVVGGQAMLGVMRVLMVRIRMRELR